MRKRRVMMNIVAVCLVVSSVVSAGLWSPSPKPNILKNGEEVIVKEGHRVVVVEQTDGTTKVHISPQDHDNVKGNGKETLTVAKAKAKEVYDEAREKAKEAASDLPNLGQGVSGPNEKGPRELVCDAFGKCKQKITGAMGQAKNKASEAEEQAKKKVSEVVGKTKDTITHKTDDISSKIEDAREKGGRELGDMLRSAKEFANDTWNYVIPPVMGVVHLLGFATAYGMCVWVTFVSSYVLAGALPRQQFGVVQSKVYPVYFKGLAFSVMVALVGHLYGQRKELLSMTVGMAQAYSLLGCIAMILYNLLYLEPRATKVMYKRMKVEKEEGRGLSHGTHASEPAARVADHHVYATSTTPPASGTQERPETTELTKMNEIVGLGKRLQKLNGYSSFLNVLTLMALTWHLVYLGQRLHVAC